MKLWLFVCRSNTKEVRCGTDRSGFTYQHLHFDGRFPGESSAASLPSPVPEENLWVQMAQAFSHTGCPCCHPTNSVKALKGTQKHQPKPEKSSTTGLLWQGGHKVWEKKFPWVFQSYNYTFPEVIATRSIRNNDLHDIYWAGLLLPQIIMTFFTQLTVVLCKYSIIVKLFYLF